MQNVLKQIGLNVVALDGRIIKQMRTYIFRCHACYKTTSIMTKVFCPNCGNKTLKKVAVTLNEEGKQEIHINFRRPLSKKGKRVWLHIFSILLVYMYLHNILVFYTKILKISSFLYHFQKVENMQTIQFFVKIIHYLIKDRQD